MVILYLKRDEWDAESLLSDVYLYLLLLNLYDDTKCLRDRPFSVTAREIEGGDSAHGSFVLERCWTDRSQDHRRYVRRLGGTWRRSFLRQGLHQGGSFCRVCRSLGRQVLGEVWTLQALLSAGDGLMPISNPRCRGLCGVFEV